jgi:hypothetical protein
LVVFFKVTSGSKAQSDDKGQCLDNQLEQAMTWSEHKHRHVEGDMTAKHDYRQ